MKDNEMKESLADIFTSSHQFSTSDVRITLTLKSFMVFKDFCLNYKEGESFRVEDKFDLLQIETEYYNNVFLGLNEYDHDEDRDVPSVWNTILDALEYLRDNDYSFYFMELKHLPVNLGDPEKYIRYRDWNYGPMDETIDGYDATLPIQEVGFVDFDLPNKLNK